MQAETPDFVVQITNAFTGTEYNYTEPFPAGDKLVLMLVVANSGASSSTIAVTPQHSGDAGRTWMDKTALTMSGTATANAVTAIYGADSGSVPNMPLMRLKLSATLVRPKISGYMNWRRY